MIRLLGLLFLASSLSAEPRATFKTRLAPVAIDAAMRANITGSGSVTAVLGGSKLIVKGSFEGLRMPATKANIRQSTAAAVRGPVILDLVVSNATKGDITGEFDLTAEKICEMPAFC